ESMIAAVLLRWLGNYIESMNAGIVTGADGMTLLYPGVVRGPDIAFVSWANLPNGVIPEVAVPELVPDFAIEVLSRGNTRAEMARMRREYFQGGVKLVWMVDPRCRTIAVYSTSEDVRVIDDGEMIHGGPVLPQWTFNTGDLFAELDRKAPPPA
ncbi:MAG: Uma2 family endonuclease, partial [Pirellula sp.]